MTDHSFFIVGCARSGTTSLAQILDQATNGECLVEPQPNLHIETRLAMEGKLRNPIEILKEKVVPRVKESKSEVHGEKDLVYGPFITHLHKLLNCKFVYITRDGRDVVRSLMDWHDRFFGTIYRECKYIGNISYTALENASNLPISKDTSDYSRPRPLSSDPLYEEWEDLTREEMCAFYWSYINELYQKELDKLPSDSWIKIDYTNPTVPDVLKVVKFLGLEGITKNTVDAKLTKKINSLKQRFGMATVYPQWMNWDNGMRDRFDRIASKTMLNLGYYKNWNTRWEPKKHEVTLP